MSFVTPKYKTYNHQILIYIVRKFITFFVYQLQNSWKTSINFKNTVYLEFGNKTYWINRRIMTSDGIQSVTLTVTLKIAFIILFQIKNPGQINLCLYTQLFTIHILYRIMILPLILFCHLSFSESLVYPPSLNLNSF